MNPIVTIIANPVNVALSQPTINVQLSGAGPQGATGPSGGLPAGGATGQVATKKSNADYDIDWETVSGGSGGGAAWGAVSGTLSAQADLQSALNAKANTSSLGTAASHAATDFAASTTTINGHALSGNVTVSASDITTGTLPAAQLPNPGSSSLGGVQAVTAVAHKFVTSISTGGVAALAQPDASDLTGLAASATTDTTNAANISSGTIPSARLGAVGGTYMGDTLATAQTITLVAYAPYAFTINSLRGLGTAGGTVTGTLKINGTAVTGCSSLSLTSTGQTVTATGANTVAAGNSVTFVTASPSSLTGLLPFSLVGTR